MTAIPATWTLLLPGVYDDNAGGLHLVVTELLVANGYPDTPANRETLLAVTREMFPGAQVVDDDAEAR